MTGRHRKPPVIPVWLAATGLGAAAMMVGSLAFASPSLPVVGMSAATVLPSFIPDPPVEPVMSPPTPVVDTAVVPTPDRRVRAETRDSVDTTSKRVRKSATETDRTTSRPKPSTTPKTSTTTPKPTTSKTTTPTATPKKDDDEPEAKAAAVCGGGSLSGTTAGTSAAGRKIMAATGFSGTVLGRAGRGGSSSDHPKGRALDFMTADGSAILAYVRAHFGELGATYAIYRQTYYPARGGSERMADRGGATANHMDHVHVSFGAGGGPSC